MLRFIALFGLLLAIAASVSQANAEEKFLVLCGKDEEPCLSALGGRVQRSGELLQFRLGNGRTKTFKTNRDACRRHDDAHCKVFYLSGLRDGFAIIAAELYEGSRAQLLRLRDGKLIDLAGLPIWSPSGEEFISGPDAFGPDEPTQIFRIDEGGIRSEFSFPASVDSLGTKEWNGKDSILIDCLDGRKVALTRRREIWHPEGVCYDNQ